MAEIKIPCGAVRPRLSEMSASTDCPVRPAQGRWKRCSPDVACLTNCSTKADGMANPMPFDPPDRVRIEVFTPIRSPLISISAPPELPGLIGASVWMKYPRALPVAVPDRARPDTMPLLTVWPTPKGLPMASTSSPTSTVSLSRNRRNGISRAPSSFRIAMSDSSSANKTRAAYSSRVFSTTRISVACPTTW